MKLKFFAMIFAILSLTTFLAAEEVQEKIYVNPSHVVTMESGFYVEIDNEIQGFSSLNIDDSGMFVLTSQMLSRGWVCVCGWVNNYDSQYCRNCGRW